MRSEFVTRAEFKKHKDVNWRRAHNILAHLKDYIPGWGYSKAEIDSFFEGYDGGKAQVHWNRVTGKPATYPPSAHNHVKADITDTPWAWTDISKAGSNLTDLVTRNHSSLQNVGNDDHHAKLHASDHQAGGTDGLSVDVPSDIGTSNQAGSQTNFVRRDHVHKHPAGLGTDLHHPQAHNHPHSALTDVTSDQHHAQDHASRHKKIGADEIKLDELGEPTDNINLNVSTSRHGLFPKLSGHEAECYAGDGAWLRLYDSTSIVIKILSKISDTIRNSNDAEKQTDIGSYDKLKETKMGEPTGEMKVYFELKSSDGELVYAKIYKNGSPVGAEKSTTSTDYVDHEDELSPLDAQDLIQLYVYSSDPSTMAYVRNLRFKYDRSINMLGENSLENPLAIEEESQTPLSMQHQDP